MFPLFECSVFKSSLHYQFQDLLNQAKEAARGAADRLRIYKAKSRMGFLRQRADGSTSLGFLTGGSGILSTNERPVSLGALIGRVKQGTGSIQGHREDRRNLCKAVYPLYYGAYRYVQRGSKLELLTSAPKSLSPSTKLCESS